MRALRLTVALLVFAALGWTALAIAAGAPRVRLVKLEPRAIVRGAGFRPQEHLLVRLVGRGTSSKRVVANDQGAFTVSLRTPPPLACGQYSLIVVRPVGRPVRVKIGPPECAPLDGGAGQPG